jgi:hypothetical protein
VHCAKSAPYPWARIDTFHTYEPAALESAIHRIMKPWQIRDDQTRNEWYLLNRERFNTILHTFDFESHDEVYNTDLGIRKWDYPTEAIAAF